VRPDKIAVTPSGIDDRALEPADGSQFRLKHALSGKIIFFMGRVHPIKGLRTLLLAMPKIIAQVKDAKLVIVGPDQIGYKKELLQLAKSLAIVDSILFLDPIQDFREKTQAYAACDVFVLPSLFEGTSQAIFGAMAQGKPIVASNCGGIPHQITNGVEGLLIPPGDQERLADSVIRLLSDPELAAKLAAGAKKRARLFSYNVLSKQLEAIYQDLIAS
jgi:glycosyltransferase involved in cell wall biosynthesis